MTERTSTINVTELIDLRPITELQIRVTLLCALTIFLDGIDVIVIGLVAPSLAAAIGVSVTSFGPVFGIGQAGVLVGVLTFGPLGDRFGRKRLVIGSMLLFATFTLLTIWTTSFDELLVVRFLDRAWPWRRRTERRRFDLGIRTQAIARGLRVAAMGGASARRRRGRSIELGADHTMGLAIVVLYRLDRAAAACRRSDLHLAGIGVVSARARSR